MSILRHVNLLSTASYVAIQTTLRRFLKLEVDTKEIGQFLEKSIGKAHGPIMKIAQTLASMKNIGLDDYLPYFENLQTQSYTMSQIMVKGLMKLNFGNDWEKIFKSFEYKAIAAASFGEIHRFKADIELIERDLVCKVQYPRMQEAIKTDMRYLDLIFSFIKSQGFDTELVKQEITSSLYEELDYLKEAQNQQYFYGIMQQYGVRVAKVYPQLSTKSVLSTEYLPSTNIIEAANITEGTSSSIHSMRSRRDSIGEKVFIAYFAPLYQHHILHTDAHMGNYGMIDDDLCLYDFGSVKRFNATEVQALKDLFFSFLEDKPERTEIYSNLGFRDINKEIVEHLDTWAKFVFEPLLMDKIQLVASDLPTSKQLLINIFNQLKSYNLTIPSIMPMLNRVTITLGSTLMRLQAKNNWHQIFLNILHDL